MSKLKSYATHPIAMHWWGFLFHAFLILGIITAAMNLTIANFTPISLFLLAIICLLAMIWNVTLRILDRMKS
ncbi:hypothetical protein ACFLTK_01330 [Chloroflexota bacterium]